MLFGELQYAMKALIAAMNSIRVDTRIFSILSGNVFAYCGLTSSTTPKMRLFSI